MFLQILSPLVQYDSSDPTQLGLYNSNHLMQGFFRSSQLTPRGCTNGCSLHSEEINDGDLLMRVAANPNKDKSQRLFHLLPSLETVPHVFECKREYHIVTCTRADRRRIKSCSLLSEHAP